ncbi:hypothetical protein D3C78_1897470 [compost metagenome]
MSTARKLARPEPLKRFRRSLRPSWAVASGKATWYWTKPRRPYMRFQPAMASSG